MPQFKHQQAPEASRHGAPSVQVIVHQLADAIGDEVAALKRARLEQDHQHVLEFVPHPVYKWQRKSLLLAIQNFSRHSDAFGQLAQDVLLLVAAELPIDSE